MVMEFWLSGECFKVLVVVQNLNRIIDIQLNFVIFLKAFIMA